MKQRTGESLMSLVAGILAMICMMLLVQEAGATDKKPPEPPKVVIDVEANAAAQANAEANSNAAGGNATASNDGNTLDAGDVTVEGDSLEVGGDTSNVENNSSTVVLVPNNNTENCLRVFGLAFGQDGSSGALGVPWRSKACDYGKAADAAAAYGNHDLAWYWRCHNKSLYGPFVNRQEGVSRKDEKASAIQACHERMAGENANMRTIALLKDELRQANARTEAARDAYELSEAHRNVCRDSLDRCEDKAYGGK